MELTKEQQAIINSSGNIKVNAIAGSGKTTTIIEYARARPGTSKILYLAFNRTVKEEAKKKFAERGLGNVRVETAHSLAYKHVVFRNNYRVRSHGYKIHEIAEILGLRGNGEKHTEYVIANHISKFLAYFCNSSERKVKNLDYLAVVSDPRAKVFVKTFYKTIEKQTRLLLGKMDSGKIEITHDFYLKKFQLSNPRLYYDYILFDEGQDASASMLDVFVRQKATKVIVGDTHQQIYGWRFAVNALEKTDFKNLYLSTSFRFNQEIADLAMDILKWKELTGQKSPFQIKGVGNPGKVRTRAVLARTNLGLLLKAIKYVQEKNPSGRIYFEGNIHSYTYADEGASLYDVLNLYNYKRKGIRDKLIRNMANINELEEYIEKTEDAQLAMMVEIVKEYGNQIPGIIRNIKEKHIDNNEREKADMVFSTVHRCKGMEYDAVKIVNDFISEEKLEKHISDNKSESSSGKVSTVSELKYGRLNEEVNLLYVAITRTKSKLYIPDELVPVDLVPSKQIHILKEDVENNDSKNAPFKDGFQPGKRKTHYSSRRRETDAEYDSRAYSVDVVRKKHRAAYRPWTQELDHELTTLYCEGVKVKELASHFGRTTGAIRMRIKKLELEDIY